MSVEASFSTHTGDSVTDPSTKWRFYASREKRSAPRSIDYPHDLPNDAAATVARQAHVAASVGGAVEIPAPVEHHGAGRVAAIAAVKIMQIIGRARFIAGRRQLEDPPVTKGTANVAHAV